MLKRMLLGTIVSTVLSVSGAAWADTVDALDGRLKLEVPENWKQAPPKSRIVEHEFQATAEDTDDTARVTMMPAGGSIDANVERWIGQFDPDGRKEPKQEKLTVGDHEVRLIELSGTFLERSGGPFAGGTTVERPNYAMVGAILVHTKAPKYQYFIKMTGPEKVVEANKKAVKEMVKELKTK